MGGVSLWEDEAFWGLKAVMVVHIAKRAGEACGCRPLSPDVTAPAKSLSCPSTLSLWIFFFFFNNSHSSSTSQGDGHSNLINIW